MGETFVTEEETLTHNGQTISCVWLHVKENKGTVLILPDETSGIRDQRFTVPLQHAFALLAWSSGSVAVEKITDNALVALEAAHKKLTEKKVSVIRVFAHGRQAASALAFFKEKRSDPSLEKLILVSPYDLSKEDLLKNLSDFKDKPIEIIYAEYDSPRVRDWIQQLKKQLAKTPQENISLREIPATDFYYTHKSLWLASFVAAS